MSKQSGFAKMLETPQPADLGPGPRVGVEAGASLNAKLQPLFQQLEVPAERRELARALVLLWHDHLDAAHGIAQGVADADGAFVHGIMHRREPDYGNAAYWFRRVGRHGAFPELSRRVAGLLNGPADAKLRHKLVPKGQWDPFGFVNACEEAAAGAGTEAEKRRLREVQRVEFEVLLEWLVGESVGQ